MAKIPTKVMTFPYLRIEASYDSLQNPRHVSSVDGGPGFIFLIMGSTILCEDSIHMLTRVVHRAEQVLKELTAFRIDGIQTKIQRRIPESINPVILWPK